MGENCSPQEELIAALTTRIDGLVSEVVTDVRNPTMVSKIEHPSRTFDSRRGNIQLVSKYDHCERLHQRSLC